jgi:hypothetical protein
MLTSDWCDAVEAERFAGPLSRLAVQGKVPMGVDLSESRAEWCLESCKASCHQTENGQEETVAMLTHTGGSSEL